MQYCDHGHEAEEIRKLPIGGGNMLVCRDHYTQEMLFRKERNKKLGWKAFDLPNWEKLEVYDG